MTMTSNYDKYIRPEVWPLPVEAIGYLLEGRNLPGNMVEVRCVGAWSTQQAGRVYILDTVPREHIHGVTEAIRTYCEACRKLIG